jgi:hypothetical protein
MGSMLDAQRDSTQNNYYRIAARRYPTCVLGTLFCTYTHRKTPSCTCGVSTTAGTNAGTLLLLSFRSLPRLPPPGEQLLWRQTVLARNRRNHCTRHERLVDDPRLLIIQELASTASPRDHLYPPFRLQLKHMVKCRHKPISVTDRYNRRSSPSTKGGVQTALTIAHAAINDQLLTHSQDWQGVTILLIPQVPQRNPNGGECISLIWSR